MQPGRNNGIEIIDIVFAFSNVKLVRELVEDNLKQLENADVSKGQTEGLKDMIVQKQRSMLKDLGSVGALLESIINTHMGPGVNVRDMGKVNLGSGAVQSICQCHRFLDQSYGQIHTIGSGRRRRQRVAES